MNRNIFILMVLLLIIPAPVNATVIDVVGHDIGLSGGRTGTSADPLEPGDTIGIKIVLRNNPYIGGPSYDGYILKEADLGLEISGPGCLTQKYNSKGQPIPPGVQPQLGYAISPIDCNGINSIYLVGPECGVPAEFTPEDVDLVWDLLLNCTGNGEVFVDLSDNNPSWYSPFYDPSCNYDWLIINDLGDLVIYQEEAQQYPICWDYPRQCHGDSTGDGFVDTADFPAFRDGFYTNYWDNYPADPENPVKGEYNPCGDYNRDGFINTDDWPEFRGWFYQWPPPDCPPGDPCGVYLPGSTKP